jgi:hypothetical protein
VAVGESTSKEAGRSARPMTARSADVVEVDGDAPSSEVQAARPATTSASFRADRKRELDMNARGF